MAASLGLGVEDLTDLAAAYRDDPVQEAAAAQHLQPANEAGGSAADEHGPRQDAPDLLDGHGSDVREAASNLVDQGGVADIDFAMYPPPQIEDMLPSH